MWSELQVSGPEKKLLTQICPEAAYVMDDAVQRVGCHLQVTHKQTHINTHTHAWHKHTQM